MSINFTKKLHESLKNDKMSFFYQGDFSDQIMMGLIEMSESNVKTNENVKKLNKRVNYLMVECLQNIDRHGKEGSESNNIPGFFGIRNIDNILFINSFNLIKNSEVPLLKEKLGQVNQLESDELKLLYQKILNEGGFSERGGAGLGLIEMARKTGEKLEFSIKNFDDNFSKFYFQLKLKPINYEGDVSLPMSEVIHIHETLLNDNAIMVYNGDFSHESIKPILNTLESNMSSSTAGPKKMVYHLMVEMLQNVSRYALDDGNGSRGIFCLNRKNEKYSIVTGNEIKVDAITALKDKIQNLQDASPEELKKLYRHQLMFGDVENKIGAGLGLIDIVRYSSEKIDYDFIPLGEEKEFYLLNAIV